jgi:6,7-dimethyl-8-ribityllumazine synthase
MAKRRKSAKQRGSKQDKMRLLLVEARYYTEISDDLLKGATQVLREAKAEFDRISVPGALEIPAAIAIAVDAAKRQQRPYDGAIALGCVIRGDTFHFDIVATQSARALIDLAVAQQLPIGNGILTVEAEQQAQTRANPDEGNKGGEAARAALAMVRLKRSLVGH